MKYDFNFLFNADMTLSLESASVQVREDACSVILVVSRSVQTSAVDINFNVIIRDLTAVGMSKIIYKGNYASFAH